MAEPIRLDLHGPLARRHVLIDATKLGGVDPASLKGSNKAAVASNLSVLLVGGDLPHGVGEEGLLQLTLTEMAALIQGVTALASTRSTDRSSWGRRRRT